MANYYEETKIDPRRFVTVTSRYADAKVIYYTEKKLLTFKTYKKRIYSPDKKDKFTVLTKKFEYRPELLSFEAYGTESFWWKIMEANNIKDIFDFKAGLNIILPDSIFL